MRSTLTACLFACLIPAAVTGQAPTVTVNARSLQPGEVVVLAIDAAGPARAVRARVFDHDWVAFAADANVWQVVVGIDLDVKPGSYRAAIEIERPGGVSRVSHPVVVTDKRFPTRRLTVAGEFVNPPPDVQARIAEEARVLSAIWANSTPERLWRDAFVRPVPHDANSAFGTRSIFNGEPRSPHGGADFLSPARTPVRAPNRGRVVLAEDLYYTGGTVVLDHGLGLVSLFAHLSRIDVTADEIVAPGQVVGLVGATGRVTGPHLHWTLRLGGTRVDPLSLLAVLGGDRPATR